MRISMNTISYSIVLKNYLYIREQILTRALHKSRNLELESSSRSWLVRSLMTRVTESSDSMTHES